MCMVCAYVGFLSDYFCNNARYYVAINVCCYNEYEVHSSELQWAVRLSRYCSAHLCRRNFTAYLCKEAPVYLMCVTSL